MATASEIETFLQGFKLKFEAFNGIIYRDDRSKNLQTLLDLEITPKFRDKIITELTPADYHKGPLEDELHKGADMWVFKKIVKGREVYIKITLGYFNNKVICISFHI